MALILKFNQILTEYINALFELFPAFPALQIEKQWLTEIQTDKNRLEEAFQRYGPFFKLQSKELKEKNIKGLLEKDFPLYKDIELEKMWPAISFKEEGEGEGEEVGEMSDDEKCHWDYMECIRNSCGLIDACGENRGDMERIANGVVQGMVESGKLNEDTGVVDVLDYVLDQVTDGNLLDQVKKIFDSSEPSSQDILKVMESMDLNPQDFFGSEELQSMLDGEAVVEEEEEEEEEEGEGEVKGEEEKEVKGEGEKEEKGEKVEKGEMEELSEEKMKNLLKSAMNNMFSNGLMSSISKDLKGKDSMENMISKTMNLMKQQLKK